MRAFATGLPWNRRLDPLERRRPFYWHKRYRNRRLNLVRSLLLTKFSDGGGVSICHYCGRSGLTRKQRNWEREKETHCVYGVATSGRVGVEDGQEAKELPQGGSLRDNVDTSVTLKRTLSRLSAARPDETDSVRSVLDARIQPPPISRNKEGARTHTHASGLPL